MGKYEEQLSEEAVLLNCYLGRYVYCVERKRSLERRRREILEEFNCPISGISYDGMPKGSNKGTGCADLPLKLDEVDTKIREQIDKASKTLEEIFKVIELLPEETMERAIIEHRYIDRMDWKKICRTKHISRTPAVRYWRKGLYMLLESEMVRKILSEYEPEKNYKIFNPHF